MGTPDHRAPLNALVLGAWPWHIEIQSHKEKEKEVQGADSGTEILEKLLEDESTVIKTKVTEEETWTQTWDQALPSKLWSTLHLELG